MTLDDQVTDMLHRRADDVSPSPDGLASIEDRIARSGRPRRRVAALAAAVVVVVAGVVAAGIVAAGDGGSQKVEVGPVDTSAPVQADDAVWPASFEGRDLADPDVVVRNYLLDVAGEGASEIDPFAADGPDRGTVTWRSGPAEGMVELRRLEGPVWYVVEARSDRIAHVQGALGELSVTVAGQLETSITQAGSGEDLRELSQRITPRMVGGATSYLADTGRGSEPGPVLAFYRLTADDGAVSISHYRVEVPIDEETDTEAIAAPDTLWPEVTFSGDEPEVALGRPLTELYQGGPNVVVLASESGNLRVYDYEGPGTASGQATVSSFESPLGRTWYVTEVRSDGVEVLGAELVGEELRVRVRATQPATLTLVATAIGRETEQRDRPPVTAAAGEVVTLTDQATAGAPQRALIKALRPDEPSLTTFSHYSLFRVEP